MYKRPDLYPNGTPIPKSLPDSYQPAVYGNAPAGQSCFTCKAFDFASRRCAKWDAIVKPKWWCESWMASGAPSYKSKIDKEVKLYKRISTNTLEEHFNGLPAMKVRLEDEEDVIHINVPLMIRLLEYAREDAQQDVDLHLVTERLIELCEEGDVLEMKNYEYIVGSED
jgi:hypothetical protein